MRRLLLAALASCAHGYLFASRGIALTGFNTPTVRCRSPQLKSAAPEQARRKRAAITSRNDEEDGSGLFGLPPGIDYYFIQLLFAQFVLFVGVGAVIPVIPLYGKSLGLSGAANGVVISAPALALLLGAQPAGRYADKARKPAMIGGMLVIALSDVGTALSSSLAPLVVARLGLGAGRCISESGERGMLADFARTSPELRGRALAAQQATIALGIAIGAPLGGVAVDAFGARAAFLCVSAAATATLLLYTFLPETILWEAPAASATKPAKRPPFFARAAAAPAGAKAGGAVSAEGGSGSSFLWRQLLADARWRGLCLAESGTKFGFAAKLTSIPLLAASTLDGGAASVGLLLSAAGLSGLIGAPAGGWLTDQRGARATAIASGAASGVSLILLPLALADQQGLASLGFIALVLSWSIGASAQTPSLTAVGQLLAPPGTEAEALALPRACGDATFIFAPAILGIAADRLAATPGAECAIAGSATLLGVLALVLTPPPPEEEEGGWAGVPTRKRR